MTKNINDSAIEILDIYVIGNRMFMIIEGNGSLYFENESTIDANNPKFQEWAELIWKFQQAFLFAKSGEKWMQVGKILELELGEK
ncbi:L-rhamnose mutarotase [Flavobacterium sp. ST-87]|uniref:L-rhamnose mutarotase n=1 Tax=Flavobacterium plantiphilum TaxID=3163297 RepID=A0ABW8XWX5_9FLAO